MAATVLEGTDAVRAAAGTHLGYSDWLEIDQARIDLFADATGDHQWIHVDPERAADGPFGTTIAHGYLTVSLTNLFLPQIVEVRGVSMGVNYGVNKIRFPAPVPVGSRLRAGAELTAVDEVHGGVQTTMTITVEIEGGDRPACIVESISRWLD
ncbi:MAG: MaoC family dehydratase [Acidimicrobiales bacterium]|nr:MaoC family dehydratase [Acidimicrobiales bacterium]